MVTMVNHVSLTSLYYSLYSTTLCSKMLTGILQLLLALSTYKSTILLHKLDVSLLGAQNDTKVQQILYTNYIQLLMFENNNCVCVCMCMFSIYQ